MKYCTKCLYPHTKPDLWFNEQGVCAACLAYETRKSIDWHDKEQLFRTQTGVLREYQHIKSPYDCIVPVSGGKDSYYQIIKAKKYGLRILAVTATTDDISTIGRDNLDGIARLGVDHIEITPNKALRRRINKYTLNTIGDISWAEHIVIFTVPVIIAEQMNIPLIIYGENSQNEYGGPEKAQESVVLDKRWLSEFGGLNGLRVPDVMKAMSVTEQDMKFYTYPTTQKVKSIFLGHYFPWDGEENAKIAKEYGFKCFHKNVIGSGINYENLDNHQTGIHDYFKYLKFGFGRATDIACNKIRRGRLTRKEAMELVNTYDGQFPWQYLDKDLEDILKYINMTHKEFFECVHKFTNKELFSLGKDMYSIPQPKFQVR